VNRPTGRSPTSTSHLGWRRSSAARPCAGTPARGRPRSVASSAIRRSARSPTPRPSRRRPAGGRPSDSFGPNPRSPRQVYEQVSFTGSPQQIAGEVGAFEPRVNRHFRTPRVGSLFIARRAVESWAKTIRPAGASRRWASPVDLSQRRRSILRLEPSPTPRRCSAARARLPLASRIDPGSERLHPAPLANSSEFGHALVVCFAPQADIGPAGLVS
jgi:hypothetical protein